ncbi:substrate-binding domain-containing protein [Bdellovibrio sp. HCB274]|uniref:substrate-binding domain-containing protein n=1 Tax=Bdellovibrio sp. HCB274 TaxID=3394361 RepID=UPI0039B4AE6D
MRILKSISLNIMGSLLTFTVGVAKAQPTEGPAGLTGKSVVFVASDLRNGGVRTVSEAFAEAAKTLHWKLKIINCMGNKNQVSRAMQETVNSKTDGIILGGFDGADYRTQLKHAKSRGIKVVGWHAAAKPGPNQYMFVNITTDAEDVAAAAAAQIPHYGAKSGGVILLTDRDYSMATTKTLALKRAIEKLKNFRLLIVEDLPLSRSDQKIPHLVKSWNQRFGKQWTHTVGINDLYFDHMAEALHTVKREDVVGIGAGDGSPEAILRVRQEVSPQLVTVAEPLRTQGWQLVDELNRAMAREKPSGYQTELIIVSRQTLNGLKAENIEEKIPYKNAYMKIWFPDKSVE